MTEATVVPLGRYRHFKGAIYRLIAVARHSETQEPMAVYHPDWGPDQVWVRPLSMFLEAVDTPTGKAPRFSQMT